MFGHPFGWALEFGLDCCCVQFVLLLVSLCVTSVTGFVFRPEDANFVSGFLAGIAILDLKHGDEFIELHLCLVHFVQIVLNHQAPLGSDQTADHGPFFFEYRFVHDVFLLSLKWFNAPLQGALFRYGFLKGILVLLTNDDPNPPI